MKYINIKNGPQNVSAERLCSVSYGTGALFFQSDNVFSLKTFIISLVRLRLLG